MNAEAKANPISCKSLRNEPKFLTSIRIEIGKNSLCCELYNIVYNIHDTQRRVLYIEYIVHSLCQSQSASSDSLCTIL